MNLFSHKYVVCSHESRMAEAIYKYSPPLLLYLWLAAVPGWGANVCELSGCDPETFKTYERHKISASFARSDEFATYDASGEETKEFSPDTRNTTTIHLGRNFSKGFFGSLTAPYIVNKRNEYQRSGWGDLLVEINQSLFRSNEGSFLPNVRISASYQSGQSSSEYDYVDPAKLDVFGAGVSQWSSGVELLNEFGNWDSHIYQRIGGPLEVRRTDFGTVKHGLEWNSVISMIYHWNHIGIIQMGATRNVVREKQLNGESITDSDSLSHDVFINLKASIAHDAKFKVGYARSAAFGVKKNSVRKNTVEVALIRSM